MRIASFAVLGLFVAMAAAAHADDWSKTYEVNGKPELAIRTTDADIHVDTWDQSTITAHVTTENVKIGEGGITIHEQQSGNAINLEVQFPHRFVTLTTGHHRVSIEVHMPREGKVNLQTGDGSIELSHLKGEMQMRSGDGHLEINAVDGDLRAHTGDGYIRAAGRFDQLDATTGDGKIEASALSGSNIRSDWSLRTGDGSVALQIPENLSANVFLHTGDGRITANVPLTLEGEIGKSELRGKLNGGGNLLTIHTGDGSIQLNKL